MVKQGFAWSSLLIALLPGCGGSNDGAKSDANDPCFTVTPDADALAAGAIAGKQTQCVGTSGPAQQTLPDGSSESTTQVSIDGEGNQRPAPNWATTVDLDLTYVGEDVVPATFHASDACGYGSPSVKVTLIYGAYDPNDGVDAE